MAASPYAWSRWINISWMARARLALGAELVDVHTERPGSHAAEERMVFDQQGLGARARRTQGRSDAGGAAADHQHVRGIENRIPRRLILRPRIAGERRGSRARYARRNERAAGYALMVFQLAASPMLL